MDENSGVKRSALLDAAVELIGRKGRVGPVPVQGVSMLPTLQEGQLLSVNFSPHTPRCGDLLVFRQGADLVVHRMLRRARFPDGSPALRTRGDASPNLDARVAPRHVVGRVVAVRNDLGWIDLTARSARTYAFAVALHDQFWAAAGVLTHLGDRLLRRLRVPSRLRRQTTRLDRALLRSAHRLFFARCHTHRAPAERIPDTTESAGSVETPQGP